MVPRQIKRKVIQSFSLICLGVLLQLPLFAQEQLMKDFAEKRKGGKTFCFYPSTLRMINISKNAEYEEFIKPIEKLIIFQLDSATSADRSYFELIKTYESSGFEEYTSYYGGGSSVFVYGKDSSVNQYIGILAEEGGTVYSFYLTGNPNLQKLPTLINTFKENQFIDLKMLQLNDGRK